MLRASRPIRDLIDACSSYHVRDFSHDKQQLLWDVPYFYWPLPQCQELYKEKGATAKGKRVSDKDSGKLNMSNEGENLVKQPRTPQPLLWGSSHHHWKGRCFFSLLWQCGTCRFSFLIHRPSPRKAILSLPLIDSIYVQNFRGKNNCHY